MPSSFRHKKRSGPIALSAEETKDLVSRIHDLERDVHIGKSNIEKTVIETKTLYREVRTVERTVHKVERIMEMFGLAVPTMAIPGVGAVTAFFMFVFQIATIAAQRVTELDKLKAERERAVELRQLRKELIAEVKDTMEAKRREQYRGIVP